MRSISNPDFFYEALQKRFPLWERTLLKRRLDLLLERSEIFHGTTADGRDTATVIVWESQEAAQLYREGSLIHEPMALEKELGLASVREGYSVAQHLG